MALRYAAHHPDAAHAVVSVAGQLPRDPAIRPTGRVPLLEVFGAADPLRPYGAGIPDAPDRQAGDPTPTLSTPETVAAFVDTAGAAEDHERPEDSDANPTDGTRVRTERWIDRDGTIEVLETVGGGGHTWPSARSPFASHSQRGSGLGRRTGAARTSVSPHTTSTRAPGHSVPPRSRRPWLIGSEMTAIDRLHRHTALALAAAALFVAWATAGDGAAGNAETDRIARVVADAIIYPRHKSAEDLTRAALDTNAGQDGRLRVIEAEDLDAPELTDPLAHLVFRIHLDASGSGFDATEAVTACYDVDFNYYGVIDEPQQIECPAANPEPIVPPPTQPPPTLAPDTRDRLQLALESLPTADRGDPPAVRTAVDALALPDASVEVASTSDAVGVAVHAGDDCVLARVSAELIEAWIPPRVYLQPGEIGCDAHAAANGEAQRPPH